jgi:hypothetical protein
LTVNLIGLKIKKHTRRLENHTSGHVCKDFSSGRLALVGWPEWNKRENKREPNSTGILPPCFLAAMIELLFTMPSSPRWAESSETMIKKNIFPLKFFITYFITVM